MWRDTGFEMSSVALVIAFDDLGNSVQTGDDRGVFMRDTEFQKLSHGPQHSSELEQQFRNSLPGARGNTDRVRKTLKILVKQFTVVEPVNLVEDHQSWFTRGPNF